MTEQPRNSGDRVDRSVNDYDDVRELLPEYERRLCPRSGEMEWTKPTDYDHSDHGPVCERHGTYLRKTLEVPCPECGTRMLAPTTPEDGTVWECAVCDIRIDRPADELTDRLSSDTFPVRGKPGVMWGECPVCGGEDTVNGGPDGELECEECHFYAGQYSDQWFAYAHWMNDEMDVRVNTERAL